MTPLFKTCNDSTVLSVKHGSVYGRLTLCPPGPVDRAVPTQGLEGLLQGGDVDPVAPQHPQELSLSADLTPRQLELAHLWEGGTKERTGASRFSLTESLSLPPCGYRTQSEPEMVLQWIRGEGK